MLQLSLWIGLYAMVFSILLCLIRVINGPSTPDRVIALDAIGINLIGIIGLIMIMQETLAYVDVVLVLGILAFISSIALAKFLERGVVIDRNSD
ncbi:Na(+) H(+) antiporter subunit F [Candidatus Syntrophocurvum alkaliphilum]|uniref:Na(+) H(+) antiporter subunit F n=1 Tax=Candidatus Syntrophocurvum alkaliphilum TaxID=2293317 RepID=A0A6I6DE22_9FIRM|nr:Na(+)/H(+) antiporter subunit F1 [Candidatus Syntrophocurvum alkaliphilum]QGT99427.1 Na(+) H(+) antiporter subunit F [Candidatus Syntrophocurvum alkaliphilum]